MAEGARMNALLLAAATALGMCLGAPAQAL